MREILFRGKRKVNGEWVHGFLFVSRKGECKIKWYDPEYGSAKTSEVYPDTVGQFTGLTDKNGVKIFEGDIIRCHTGRVMAVKFGQHFDEEYGTAAYGWFVTDNEGTLSFDEEWGGLEVIGNIHDNPERLGGDDNEDNS